MLPPAPTLLPLVLHQTTLGLSRRAMIGAPWAGVEAWGCLSGTRRMLPLDTSGVWATAEAREGMEDRVVRIRMRGAPEGLARIIHERTREFSGSMTNDQFPMTNDGWRAQRAVKERHGDAIPIGHLSLGFGHSRDYSRTSSRIIRARYYPGVSAPGTASAPRQRPGSGRDLGSPPGRVQRSRGPARACRVEGSSGRSRTGPRSEPGSAG